MDAIRKLAAIMFTDISGYTAVMQEDERTALAIRSRHRAILKEAHQKYYGEVLQYYGDGTLSIFKSAVEAVECAIAMQQSYQSGEIVPVRIGIHLGDIVLSENEVYGDGVNLASRVEALGIPGSILISDKLHFAIKNHRNISAQSVGIFEFKNILTPVEVFAVSNHGIRIPQRSELKGKLKEKKKSIAVLPFVNMSSDPENAYFSDGIAEEILNALAKVEGLKVTARTSSFAFKDKNMDVREIGRQLGVEHILEGSVRKAGNRVRVTAQLVSTVDGYHFFSETYDGHLEDIFAVQDEIALKITTRLREHLGESERAEPMVVAPTFNMEAYEAYLRGLYYVNQWRDEALDEAVPYFEKAIALQEDFALPHARMGLCFLFQAFGGKLTWAEAYQKAIVHFDRTRELNVEAPEVYFGLFIFQVFFQWDWQSAYHTTKKALELFPNYPSFHHAVSTLYYIEGNTEKALIAHQKGLALDPFSIEMNFYMGVMYIWHGDPDKAIPFFNKVLGMVPNHRTVHEYLGWIAALQGEYEKALSIFQNLQPEVGYRLHRSTCLGWVYYKLGEKEKTDNYFEQMRFLESATEGGVGFSLDLATLCAGRGDIDLAFNYLEKAITHKIGDSMMCFCDPFLKPLRSDPRITHIKSLIGKPPSLDDLLEHF